MWKTISQLFTYLLDSTIMCIGESLQGQVCRFSDGAIVHCFSVLHERIFHPKQILDMDTYFEYSPMVYHHHPATGCRIYWWRYGNNPNVHRIHRTNHCAARTWNVSSRHQTWVALGWLCGLVWQVVCTVLSYSMIGYLLLSYSRLLVVCGFSLIWDLSDTTKEDLWLTFVLI